MYEYRAYFDTSAIYYNGTRNIEACYYAWILFKKDKLIDWRREKVSNINNNTSGELVACAKLLDYILSNNKIKKVQIYGDCQSSIDALNNLIIPKGTTEAYYQYTLSILNHVRCIGKKIKITWIPRESNWRADRLASKGIITKNDIKPIKIEYAKSFAIFHISHLLGIDEDNNNIKMDTIPIKYEGEGK